MATKKLFSPAILVALAIIAIGLLIQSSGSSRTSYLHIDLKYGNELCAAREGTLFTDGSKYCFDRVLVQSIPLDCSDFGYDTKVKDCAGGGTGSVTTPGALYTTDEGGERVVREEENIAVVEQAPVIIHTGVPATVGSSGQVIYSTVANTPAASSSSDSDEGGLLIPLLIVGIFILLIVVIVVAKRPQGGQPPT